MNNTASGATRFYVRRERTRDESPEWELGYPSKVGQIRFSKTFRTRAAAQREADAWASTGDYRVSVEPGKSPPRSANVA